MANFILKNILAKNVQDKQLWKKNDLVIERIEFYSWGQFLIKTDTDSVIDFGVDINTECSIDLYNCGYETDLISLDDCWAEEIKWPDSLTPFARDTLESKWNKDPYNSWQEDGWDLLDVKMIFNGPLELTKIENDI